LITDSYLVVDEYFDVIDYNESFEKTFGKYIKIERNINIIELLSKDSKLDFDAHKIAKLITAGKNKNKHFSLKLHLSYENFDRHYNIEVAPMFSKQTYLGSIIIFKDITQNVKDLETIKENQAILLEQERLASLGQLIGGIAHNLKTPIMSISGGIEALKDLVYEYRDSVGDKSVTDQDHKDIARDMLTWLEKMGPYCAYMSDVISAVKGQAVQMINCKHC
jgi:signal transduction histidine kinase